MTGGWHVFNAPLRHDAAILRPLLGDRIVRCLILTVLAALSSLVFGGTADASVWKTPDRLDERAVETTRIDRSLQYEAIIYLSQKPGKPNPNFDNLAPEDRTRMQRQYREWQSLPPEQRDTMRQRMDDLRRMPPPDRERYQQRYQQWQQLSPEDRRRLENNLQRWDNLSPQERESIRERFKN